MGGHAPSMTGSRTAVFLDRDGVLVRAMVRDGKPYPPATLEEFEILSDAPGTLTALQRAGYLLIVTTNQPDVATGKQRRDVVEAMHERLRAALPLDDIEVCYHTDRDGCACRKPLPGMLLAAAAKWKIDLAASVMVGDRWRDIDAGKAAGCRAILIERGYREVLRQAPDLVVGSLAEAGAAILAAQL